MAKVIAPLLSLSATGTLAKTLTYSKTRHFHYLKDKDGTRKKRDIITPGRQQQRDAFFNAKEAWLALDDETKQEYNNRKYPTGQTGYNRFISEYLKQEEVVSSFPYLLAVDF